MCEGGVDRVNESPLDNQLLSSPMVEIENEGERDDRSGEKVGIFFGGREPARERGRSRSWSEIDNGEGVKDGTAMAAA